jgi:DNA repair photolyase
MIIPNDTGHPWRLNKFVEYQHKVPPIHPVIYVEYAKHHKLGVNDCIWLAWLISVTYCEVTTLYMFEKLDWRTLTVEQIETFWKEQKPKLIFGSARKHVKNADWFVSLMTDFLTVIGKDPEGWLMSLVRDTPVATYKSVMDAIRAIRFTGRFSGDLFLEALIYFSKNGFIDIKLEEPEVLDWKHCSNLTSGLFNVLYMDKEADQFDETGHIAPEHFPILQKGIHDVQKAIQKRYPEQDATIPLVITKLCSFRNLFKSSRYGGFHHDRELENIIKYEKNYPEEAALWKLIYDIRARMFHPSLLGEVGGWNGIRKERKKLWVEKGLTGVEDVPPIEDFSKTEREPEPVGESADTDEMDEITVTVRVPKELRDILQRYTLTLSFGSKENPQPELQIEPQSQPKEPEQPEVQEASPDTVAAQPDTELTKAANELKQLNWETVSENGWEAVFEGAQGSLPFVKLTPEAQNLLENCGLMFIDSKMTLNPQPVQKPAETCVEKPVTSKPAEGDEQDDEEMRNPIKSDIKPRFMIVAPYDYTKTNRVDKTYPEKIKKAWANKEIDFCYFPIDPFHYREVKRHATQIAVEACLEHNIPFSMETRREIPAWCVEALARNKFSEVRVHLNTLDERKWKLQYPEASKPKELLGTIINCFNGGAYVILRIAPIIPVIVEPVDVFQTVDAVKNWVESVEVTFASFNEAELGLLKERTPDNYEAIMAYYRNINGRWYVRDEYRKEFLQKLDAFAQGWKIKLKVLNEIAADVENNVVLLDIRSKKSI